MPVWDSAVYLKFASERGQPSLDLISRVNLRDPRRIMDLGCGPGNSTQALRERWPDASITGLDSSAEMIESAKRAHPGGSWIVGDASTWTTDTPFDLIFSNAMLQWVPNHASLCRHHFAQLAPNGALAVQAPAHYDSVLHREIIEVSKDPAWNERMQGARDSLTNHPPAFYYDVLQPLASRLDIWETTYYHVVAGPEAIIEWFRGTGLRPYLETLTDEGERRRFEELLLDRYTVKYPRQPDGRVLFPFRRLFFVAYR